jgi:peroxiredoxin
MKLRMVSAVLAIAAMLGGGLSPAVHAQGPAAELGVARGIEAPAIAGVNQAGAPVSFATLKGENGLVIAFVRSADWCPFCQKQMQDLNTIADELKARGFGLAALSYDSVDTLAKFAKAKKIGYTLISDPDSNVIDAFGLRNLEVAGNKRFDGIPHPAIYVIGADGRILDKLYEEKYTKRPPTDVVLKAVDAAAAKAKG